MTKGNVELVRETLQTVCYLHPIDLYYCIGRISGLIGTDYSLINSLIIDYLGIDFEAGLGLKNIK